ncbi:hypothetical protein AB1L42_10915 [Thalassoglobus sp. JC818]|uniref:type IV pilus modification PilV family protein n=1 Tax=Thalassoglobus sp. JC818 TaxID=3232136 RepID=UPI00345AB5D0
MKITPTIKRSSVTGQNRRGWTLIEVLLIVTMTSTIGILGTKLISRLISMGGQFESQTQGEFTAQRFEDQLRIDVESAETAEPFENGIQLFLPNGEAIQYTLHENNSVRRNGPRPGGTAYETFQFPESIVSFELRPSRVFFTCVPEKVTDSFQHRVFNRPWTISTTLGRRNRLVSEADASSSQTLSASGEDVE